MADRLRLFALLGLALLVATAAPAQNPTYVIGGQDVLSVSVFDQPDLGGKFTVEEDGTFTFPLVGRLKVGGLTLREAESLVRRELSNGFLKNPQVSVMVEQYRSQRYFVVGEVRAPGTYPLTGEMTLIEALARAGSTLPAAGQEILLVRPKAGVTPTGPAVPAAGEPSTQTESEITRINVQDLQSGQAGQTIRLRDYDTIYVPAAEQFFVAGQVRNPGSFPFKRGMTVLQALALAGGVTDRGASNRITVKRLKGNIATEIKLKLEDPVFPGDTLVVPERFF